MYMAHSATYHAQLSRVCPSKAGLKHEQTRIYPYNNKKKSVTNSKAGLKHESNL
jgi:hypothetical protein